jgi:hypothetical protein
MSAYVSTTSAALQSVDDEMLQVLLHSTDGSVECNIFYIPCTQVEIDGVSAKWVTDSGSYDCVELPCEHKFNACALALHFLTNHMTCPLCRHGVHARMSPACVPENIKCMHLKHISPDADDAVELLEFESDFFLQDLRLHVDFMSSCTDTAQLMTLTTPCVEVEHSETHSIFRTHRSFRRHFNSFLRLGRSDACRFSLLHPLIFISLCSDDVRCDAMSGLQFSLPHEVAEVCCCMQHDIMNVTLKINLAVLYSMCASSVLQYLD